MATDLLESASMIDSSIFDDDEWVEKSIQGYVPDFWEDIPTEEADAFERIIKDGLASFEEFDMEQKKQEDEAMALELILKEIRESDTSNIDDLQATIGCAEEEESSLLAEAIQSIRESQRQQDNRRSSRKVKMSARLEKCKESIALAVFEELSGKHATFMQPVTYDMCYKFAFKQICELEEIANGATKLESILAKKTLKVMESNL